MKISIFLILFGVFVLALPASAKLEAIWPTSPLGTELQEDSLTILIKYLYEWLVSLGGLFAFIFLIWTGFQYLTSAGNVGKMRQAKERVFSSALGLILLLTSVLVLNTINPQLTTLEMPELPLSMGTAELKIDFQEIGEPCQYVELYENVDYDKDTKITIDGTNKFEPGTKISDANLPPVLSVKIEGSCQLILYPLANYEGSSNNPALPVSSNVENISVYGLDPILSPFQSFKVINLFGGVLSEEGVYLCDGEGCTGEFYYIPPTADAMRNLGDWDNRTVSVGLKKAEVRLYNLQGLEGRSVCFNRSVSRLDSYDVQPNNGWNLDVSSIDVLSRGQCRNPGLLIRHDDVSYNPTVFLFDQTDYRRDSDTNIGPPFEYFPSHLHPDGYNPDGRENIWSGYNDNGTLDTNLTTYVLSIKITQEEKAVRLWEGKNRTRDTICFRDSVSDLRKYSFDKNKSTNDLTNDILSLEVIDDGDCPVAKDGVTEWRE